MKVHILQHTDETTPGLTMDWLFSRNLTHGITRFFQGETLPRVEEFDFLVICGGGMGVNDEEKYAWMKAEKEFIRKCLELDKPVVGLCLGAQLIASSLGAEVKKHSAWEIGWHDVEIKNFGKLKAFQYHQDTFALPNGAELIASNPICQNQGFRIGEKVLAVQFHPEATAEWVAECADDRDLPSGKFVQSPDEMKKGVEHIPRQRDWFFSELDRILNIKS